MVLPTSAELNGRPYYTVLTETETDGALFVRYAGTDQTRAYQVAMLAPKGIVVTGQIEFDAREDGR